MRVRVVSGLVGVGILAVVYAFLDTLLLNLVIGAISIMAVVEMLKASGILKHRSLTALAVTQAVFIPFVRAGYVGRYAVPILFAVVIGYFALLVRSRGGVAVEQCAMAFMFSTILPLFFSCAVYIRDDHGAVIGGFYLLVALGSGWLSDTGAYFVGTCLGRHKLAPEISPKKTVEGSVGGLVVCTSLLLLSGWGYTALLAGRGIAAAVDYPLLAVFAMTFSVIGMLGDLSASAIKRRYGIKDFGNIMPGHGGILDRFDSVLFTLPAVYAVVRHAELLYIL